KDEPEGDRGDATGALPAPPFLQLGEDGNERGREGRVRDEGAYEVRDLERDGEGVDLPGRSKVVRGHDLPDEAEDAGDPGGEREDRRRPCESAAGALVHAPSIARGPLVPSRRPHNRGLFHAIPNMQRQQQRL